MFRPLMWIFSGWWEQLTYLLTYLLTYVLTYLLTHSMEQSPSWEAKSFLANQEITRILWNPEVHYRRHKRPPPVPILSQLSQSMPLTSHFLKIPLNSLAAAVNKPAVYRRPTFRIPNSMFLFRCSVRTKVISPGPGLTLWLFRKTMRFLRWWVVSTSPNPQAGGPPLVGWPQLLYQYIRSSPPYRRPFLHPQHEDAPCRGDRDPVITGWEQQFWYN
jgi:hypothetical protein